MPNYSNPNPEFSQDRSTSLTVTFSEESKGWICFKSFIQDSGLSLNNDYYTIKNGELWKHHSNETRNNFYDIQEQSFVDVLFNEQSATVKSFASMKYEGSQAKITENLTDGEYYNNIEKPGWYVEFGITDLQASGKMEFKTKEGKWFSNMRGWSVKDVGGLNSKEFSFQGIDELESIVDNGEGGEAGGGGGGSQTNVRWRCGPGNICIPCNQTCQDNNPSYVTYATLSGCQANCPPPPPPPPPPSNYHLFEICAHPGITMNFFEVGASTNQIGSQEHFDYINTNIGTVSIGDVLSFDLTGGGIQNVNSWQAEPCYKYLGTGAAQQTMYVESTLVQGWALHTDCNTCHQVLTGGTPSTFTITVQDIEDNDPVVGNI